MHVAMVAKQDMLTLVFLSTLDHGFLSPMYHVVHVTIVSSIGAWADSPETVKCHVTTDVPFRVVTASSSSTCKHCALCKWDEYSWTVGGAVVTVGGVKQASICSTAILQ